MVQTPLQNRPGHQYQDDWKPSEGNTDDPDNPEEAFNGPDAEYPEGHPSRKKSMSDDELANAEDSAGAKADKKPDDSSDEENSLYKSSKRKKKRRGLTRRQGGILGAVAVFIVTAFMAVITQGPGLVITHVRDMLLSRVGIIEQYNSRKYRQGKIVRARNLLSKDGRMGQKIIGEMELRGYSFRFDPQNRNRIIDITTPNGRETRVLDGIGEEIDSFLDKRHSFRSARWKTKRMNAFYTKFGVTRTSVVDPARASPDEDPERTVNKAVANDVVDDNPQELDAERFTDSEEDTDAQRSENARKNEIGDKVDNAADETGAPITDTQRDLIENGTPIEEIDTDVANGLDGIESGVSKETIELVDGLAKGTLGGKVWSATKEFLNPTDILDRMCTMRNRVRQAQAAGRAARAVKMMRYAGVFIKSGDDIRRGNADMKLVNKLMQRVMSEDSNGNSFSASSGFSSLSSGTFSRSQNSATRNKVGVDGKLTGVAAGIKGVSDEFPGMSKCWLWQNPGFQVASGTFEVAKTIVSCIFSGCASEAAEEGAKIAASQVVKAAVRNAVQNTIRSVMTKRFAATVALSVAADYGIEYAMAYMQLYVEKSMRLPYTGQEKGGELSNILTGGTGTMEARRSAAAGLVPATPQQYAAAQREYFAWKKEQKSKQSFFARVLDYNNPDSLAFNGMTAAIGAGSNNTTTTVTNVAQSATSLLNGGLFASVGSMFGGSASAAENDHIEFDEYAITEGEYVDEKIATDMAGNMHYIMRNDIEQIDPEANEEALIASGDIDPSTKEPISSAFRDYMDSCVDTPDVYSNIEFEDKDCLATKSETKRFAAHLAWVDLNDGLEAEFFPETIETAPAATTGGGGSTPSSTVTDKRQDTSGMACAPTGLTSERIEPIGDGSVRIKLCDYGDVRGINASWSTAVSGLITAAARDGITFSSGGFRTAAEQIRLRQVNGCPDIYTAPPSSCRVATARPGQSNHELGLAMDMRDMCFPRSTCAGNPRYDWLSANASRWGISKLSSEAWHWSVDGR